MRDLVRVMLLSGLCLFAAGVYAHEEEEEEVEEIVNVVPTKNENKII